MDDNQGPIIIPLVDSKENIVMKENLENSNISKESFIYSTWKDYLTNIANQTTKTNSIILSWQVNSNICSLKVTNNTDNNLEIIKEQTFNYDEEFKKELLEAMLIQWIKTNHIIAIEVIPSTTEGLFDYKAVSENNDHLHIFGLKPEYANYLADISSNTNDKKVEEVLLKTNSQSGISDTLIIVFTFIMVSIALVATVYFTISN